MTLATVWILPTRCLHHPHHLSKKPVGRALLSTAPHDAPGPMPAFTPLFTETHSDQIKLDATSHNILNPPTTFQQDGFLRANFNKAHLLTHLYCHSPPINIHGARKLCSSLGSTSAVRLVMVDLENVLTFVVFTNYVTVLGWSITRHTSSNKTDRRGTQRIPFPPRKDGSKWCYSRNGSTRDCFWTSIGSSTSVDCSPR